MGKLDGLNEEDKRFLKNLETRVHSIKNSSFIPNMGGRTIPVALDDYKESKLTVDEIEKVLSISESASNVVLRPLQSNFGFFPCYEVLFLGGNFPGTEGERNYLLRFSKHQLPEGYNFNRLKEYFCSKDNLRKAGFAGIKFETEENAYDY